MKISENVLSIITGFEPLKDGQKLTKKRTDEINKSIASIEEYVNANILSRYKLNQKQYDALVIFGTDMGVNGLARLTRNGKNNVGSIADSFLNFDTKNGKKDSSLLKRRKLEQAIFIS